MVAFQLNKIVKSSVTRNQTMCSFTIFRYNNIIMNESFKSIINQYKDFSEVKAIALGGSGVNNTSDHLSDIDVYIFVDKDILVSSREEMVKRISSKYEVGCEYFGSGDEFLVDKLDCQLDIMYWNVNWFENIIENIWFKHYPSNGYTTAFLFTLNNFQIIYDTDNWLLNLQTSIQTEYPNELKQNIIKRNIMLMKDKPFASYYEQIEKAVKRNDVVSINHRITAFLASYFDIIFAVNELLHPGEKRLIQYAKDNCSILPDNFEENIKKLLIQSNFETLNILNDMVEKLRKIIL